MKAATPKETENYTHRFQELKQKNFYRVMQGLWVSSIGVGTYLGGETDEEDAAYAEAIETALRKGCNVVDTAVNYRCMRSERVIGRVLRALFESGGLRREEVIVATKGGFLPFDGKIPLDPMAYFLNTFIRPGIMKPEDLASGCHCMAPAYLRHQLQVSLNNLQLEAVDVYFVHNPEMQLGEIPRDVFHERLEKAFRELEHQAREGKLSFYGVATWSGFRVAPNHPSYLSLFDLWTLAEKAGGSRHRFRVIELPYNLAMPEAFGHKNQQRKEQLFSVLQAAEKLGLSVWTSASLAQGGVIGRLPEALRTALGETFSDAGRALQFARSTPGVTVALAGMKRREHVLENLQAAAVFPIPSDKILSLYR